MTDVGEDEGGPEDGGDDPGEGAVDIVGGHDFGPEIAADTGGHGDEHECEGGGEPAVAVLEDVELSAMAEDDAGCDDEGDGGEAADECEVEEGDPESGEEGYGEEAGDEEGEGDLQPAG